MSEVKKGETDEKKKSITLLIAGLDYVLSKHSLHCHLAKKL